METTSHVCLIGEPLCRNWPLVQRLAGRHHLTLLIESEADRAPSFLAAIDVVALDCRRLGADGSIAFVSTMKREANLPIVVLNGGLRKTDIARLFDAGVQDYFSEPFNVALIAERLEHLADANRSKRELVEGRT